MGYLSRGRRAEGERALAVKFTPSQWEAVKAIDQHVLVAAGAGTGKTRTVVGRILYMVGVPINGHQVEHPCALRDIAAVTFTNAAAADLKRKVRGALRDSHRHDDAYLVDTARIGTIHAFCSEILHEFALRAGANPREEILDEVASLGLITQLVRDTVVTAIETGAVAGLDDLLTIWSVRDLERFLTGLVRDPDRLRVLRAERGDMGPREHSLLDLASQASDLLNQRLEERGQIDFDRIITRTRDLMQSDERLLAALRRRLRVLIVDEFQDVDPVQKEIAYLLGAPLEQRDDTPRLMLVGDPKQSIYRFRRADVSVWSEVERDFSGQEHTGVVGVSENFRSTAPILGFVDTTIGKILERAVDGEAHRPYEVRYRALEIREANRASGAPVELLVVPVKADGRDYRADEVRQIEASAVARRARELVDAGEADWGDMAVIVPTWSTVSLHRDALEAVGGRGYPLRTGEFYEQREIVDLLLALEAVRDPHNDRPLLGFLRSPFVGVKDETLLDMARQVKGPYWASWRDCEVAEGALLAWGMDLLERHVLMRDRVPVDELLESLLEDAGYLAHLYLLGRDRTQAVANVEKFLREARTAARQPLGAFLRTIGDMRKLTGEEGSIPLVVPRDAVTLTTVHSAKGLQWKVVFWCDLVQRVRFSERRDLLIGRKAIALKEPELDPEQASAQWQGLKDELSREEYAERKRVWYVAATRAAERLFICGLPAGSMTRNASQTVADHVWGALGVIPLEDGATFTYESADGTPFEGLVRLADPSVLGAPPRRPPPEHGAISPDVLPQPLLPLPARVGPLRHSASELLAFSRCQRKHWFLYVVGVREPEVDRSSAELIDAATRGMIVHDVLEHLRQRDELDHLLEDAIHRCDPDAPAPEEPVGQRYRRLLRDEITRVADHPDYRRIADLPTARRELQFVHIDGPRACYAGGIDLAAREGTGLVLLDVKTSAQSAEEARIRVRQYRPQRDVYVAAAERISGLQVGRFAFQFSRSALQISDRISDAERRELPGILARVLEEMGRGAPRLTAFPTECRFCGFRRVGWCSGVEETAVAGSMKTDRGGDQLSLDFT